MFDKIKLVAETKNNDLQLIIETNNLKEISREGKISYDNIGNKKNGMYIKIDIDKGSIILDGSLHKYFNNLQTSKQENHSNNFTISEMMQTFELLMNRTNINFYSAKVNHLEIGLNLYVSNQPIEYINLIKSISPKGKKEKLKIIENPKYKNKSEIVTNMHTSNRKYFKIYDKIHELKDKRQPYPENLNILRIETVWQRIDNLKIHELLHQTYIKGLITEFINTWSTVEFKRKLVVPKGTNQAQTQLITEIIECGNAETVLENYRNKLKTKEITERRFRTIREFIQMDWNTLKHCILYESYPEELEFRNLLFEQTKKSSK